MRPGQARGFSHGIAVESFGDGGEVFVAASVLVMVTECTCQLRGRPPGPESD